MVSAVRRRTMFRQYDLAHPSFAYICHLYNNFNHFSRHAVESGFVYLSISSQQAQQEKRNATVGGVFKRSDNQCTTQTILVARRTREN
jgi:hypothetical protein